MSLSKRRTVAYPHRLFNKASIFLSKLEPFESAYKSITMIDADTKLIVSSNHLLTPKDGRIFDYVLSRIQATRPHTRTMELDTKDIIEELGMKNRTENRKMIINSLIKLTNLQVELNWSEGLIRIAFFESVESLDGTLTVRVTLSNSFVEAMDPDVAKTRYINIGYTMQAKSVYAIELAKLLQIDGQGVEIQTGKPKPVRQIQHSRICRFLGLDADINNNSSKAQLRKAFNELEMCGYPIYRLNTRREHWKIHS